MKVYSLYYKDGSFLGAFSSRELAVNYGKMSCADEDAWDYDVIEEYLSKSPLTYSEQQQRTLFQQTYNKNLECRQALKNNTKSFVNEICGEIPQIQEFVK